MPQVKITIKEDTYKKLKKAAEKNYRTTTEEINFRLAESFTQPQPQPSTTPLQPFTPPPDPITNPPYKITLDNTPETNNTTQPDANHTAPDTPTTTHTKHKDIPERWMRLQRHRPK